MIKVATKCPLVRFLKPRSQSLAITFWGIFELIVKESGGERSDGKKEKASLPARALLSFPSFPRAFHLFRGFH